MAVHGMIDLETLGVEPDSVIITLGAIKFDPYTDEDPHSGLYLRCDIEEQSEKYHRTIDENTLECPWNFWQIRDSRTLFAMMPSDPRKAIQEELHNALADCYYQAKCVQSTYKHFGVKSR